MALGAPSCGTRRGMGLFRRKRKGDFRVGNHPKNAAYSRRETAMKRWRRRRCRYVWTMAVRMDLYGQNCFTGVSVGHMWSTAYQRK